MEANTLVNLRPAYSFTDELETRLSDLYNPAIWFEETLDNDKTRKFNSFPFQSGQEELFRRDNGTDRRHSDDDLSTMDPFISQGRQLVDSLLPVQLSCGYMDTGGQGDGRCYREDVADHTTIEAINLETKSSRDVLLQPLRLRHDTRDGEDFNTEKLTTPSGVVDFDKFILNSAKNIAETYTLYSHPTDFTRDSNNESPLNLTNENDRLVTDIANPNTLHAQFHSEVDHHELPVLDDITFSSCPTATNVTTAQTDSHRNLKNDNNHLLNDNLSKVSTFQAKLRSETGPHACCENAHGDGESGLFDSMVLGSLDIYEKDLPLDTLTNPRDDVTFSQTLINTPATLWDMSTMASVENKNFANNVSETQSQTGVQNSARRCPELEDNDSLTIREAKSPEAPAITLNIRSSGGQKVSSKDVEVRHVRDVYARIAPQCHHVRQKAWPRVKCFLRDLSPGALVADVGCGNGRYLSPNLPLYRLGSDTCMSFLKQARGQGHEVNLADNTCLPYRDSLFDGVISIGVIHHFASVKRRILSLSELARILAPGGRVMIYAWAFEQTHRKFETQDVLIPWVKPDSKGRIRRRHVVSCFSESDRTSISSLGSSASDDEASSPTCRRRRQISSHRGRELSPLCTNSSEAGKSPDNQSCEDEAEGGDEDCGRRFGVFDKRDGSSLRPLKRPSRLEGSAGTNDSDPDALQDFELFERMRHTRGPSHKPKWPNQLVSECRKLGKFLRSLSTPSQDQEMDLSDDTSNLLNVYLSDSIDNDEIRSETSKNTKHIEPDFNSDGDTFSKFGESYPSTRYEVDPQTDRTDDQEQSSLVDTSTYAICADGTDNGRSNDNGRKEEGNQGCSCEITDNNNFTLIDVPSSYQNVQQLNDPKFTCAQTSFQETIDPKVPLPINNAVVQTSLIENGSSYDPFLTIHYSGNVVKMDTQECHNHSSGTDVMLSNIQNTCWSNNITSCVPLNDQQSETSASSSDTSTSDTDSAKPFTQQGSTSRNMKALVPRTSSATSLDPISDSCSVITSSDSSFQKHSCESTPMVYDKVRMVDDWNDNEGQDVYKKYMLLRQKKKIHAKKNDTDETKDSTTVQYTDSQTSNETTSSRSTAASQTTDSFDTDSVFSLDPEPPSANAETSNRLLKETHDHRTETDKNHQFKDEIQPEVSDNTQTPTKRGTFRHMFQKIAGIFQKRSNDTEYSALSTECNHSPTSIPDKGSPDGSVNVPAGSGTKQGPMNDTATTSKMECPKSNKINVCNSIDTNDNKKLKSHSESNNSFLSRWNMFKSNKSKQKQGFIDDVRSKNMKYSDMKLSLSHKEYTVNVNNLAPEINHSFMGVLSNKVTSFLSKSDSQTDGSVQCSTSDYDPKTKAPGKILDDKSETSSLLSTPSLSERPNSLDFSKKRTRWKLRRSDIVGSAPPAVDETGTKEPSKVESKELSLAEAMTLIGDGASEASVVSRLDQAAKVVFAEMKRLKFAIRQFPRSSLDSDDDPNSQASPPRQQVKRVTYQNVEPELSESSVSSIRNDTSDNSIHHEYCKRNADPKLAHDGLLRSKRYPGVHQTSRDTDNRQTKWQENRTISDKHGQRYVPQSVRDNTTNVLDSSPYSGDISNNADDKPSNQDTETRHQEVSNRGQSQLSKDNTCKIQPNQTLQRQSDTTQTDRAAVRRDDDLTTEESDINGRGPARHDGTICSSSLVTKDHTTPVADTQLSRYYHVFRKGELDKLITDHVSSLEIVESFYDHGNWCVIARKR